MHAAAQALQVGIAAFRQRARSVKPGMLQPKGGETLRQPGGELVAQLPARCRFGIHQLLVELEVGREVDLQRLVCGCAVAGDLQDCRAAEATMREQQVFQEPPPGLAAADRHLDRQRQPGQGGKRRPGRRVKGQRHQRGAWLDDVMAESRRQAQAPVAGADLGDRQATGCDDDASGAHQALGSVELKAAARVRPDVRHAAGLPARDAAGFAFPDQQLDDLFAGVIAEQLALVLFMEGDAMRLNQLDEICRRVAGQGGAAKSRVVGQKVGRADFTIREIATPTAGDTDFFSQPFGVIDQQHAQPALPGLPSAEQARCARTHHHRIESPHSPPLIRAALSRVMRSKPR
mmetsp:Transcript_39157/g.91835  ORF Transcript_39157/g.91835 Transcript_39157/m.91835 type:complete len:346 (+) Transcript_39157:489-1526(+)